MEPALVPIQILLVEDHADTAAMLRILLTCLGYKVWVAGTVTEALNLAVRQRFDVLLCDFGLPDGDGCDVLAPLRQLYPIKSIAVTGFAFEEDHQRAAAAGFDHFLAKPYDFRKLENLLGRIAVPPSPASDGWTPFSSLP